MPLLLVFEIVVFAVAMVYRIVEVGIFARAFFVAPSIARKSLGDALEPRQHLASSIKRSSGVTRQCKARPMSERMRP